MSLSPIPSNRPLASCQRAVIKNWKTTTIGLVIAFTGFVTFSPDTFGGSNSFIVILSRYITSGGLAVLGIASKDYSTNGESQSQ